MNEKEILEELQEYVRDVKETKESIIVIIDGSWLVNQIYQLMQPAFKTNDLNVKIDDKGVLIRIKKEAIVREFRNASGLTADLDINQGMLILKVKK